MPITKRTLEKWRKEALVTREHAGKDLREIPVSVAVTLSERIIRLTQELLDNHLIGRREH